ncbi:hypothetical protein L7F22_030300 [Adiantum nelumboides]|nr:hypothetical protein [Adiantum nelumboides]
MAFRLLFVTHQGKKELIVSQTGSLGSADYAQFVLDMVSQLRANNTDLSFCDLFGFYVNTNTEAFCLLFLAHQGKKELIVSQTGSLGSADYAQIVLDMVSHLSVNITNLSFCDLVLPRFSTTTHDDTIVATVALMAIVKKYFDYKFRLGCGTCS